MALHNVLFDLPPGQNYRFIPFEFASTSPFTEDPGRRILRVLIGVNRFLFTLARNSAIEVVHVNTAPDQRAVLRDSLLILVSRLLGRKVVLQVHGAVSDHHYPQFLQWVMTRTFPLCSIVLLFSSRDTQTLRTMIPRLRADIFPNAIRSRDFIQNGKSFRKDVSIPQDNRVVIFLSRIIKEKGVFELVESIPAVVKEFKAVTFIFAGDGPEIDPVKRVCKDSGIEEYVRFTGHLPYKDVTRALVASDVFVLPTYYIEGMPTAILQALAAGLPVITTPAGGIPEVIKTGENGFLIQPRSPRQLAEKILLLLQQDDLRDQIGRSNSELARKEFDIEIIAKKLGELYSSL